MNKLKNVLIVLIVMALQACTTVKVAEIKPELKIPSIQECRDYELLKGKSFADALDVIVLNAIIYEDCVKKNKSLQKYLEILAN